MLLRRPIISTCDLSMNHIMDIKWLYDGKSIHSWAIYSSYLKDNLLIQLRNLLKLAAPTMKRERS